MGKGVRTALLCLVFVVFAAGGYVLGGLFTVEKPVEEVVAAPVLSPVPVFVEGSVAAPVRAADGTYDLAVMAAVETGDVLIYELWGDEACTVEVRKSTEGNFTKLPATDSETYYLRVQNLVSKDYSAVVPVKGFTKPQPQLQMYQKITKEELYSIFEKGLTGAGIEKGFNRRLAPGFKITATNAIEGEIMPTKPEDIYTNIRYNAWDSVTIAEPLKYDQQGRLINLVITIKYPL